MSDTLLQRLIPLVLFVFMGMIAGRLLKVGSQHIAGIMIYLLTPLVVFHGTLSARLAPDLLAIPLLVWLLAAGVALLMLRIGQRVFRDSRANILALGSACGNTGYFGIPVALVLLGEAQLGLYIVVMLGVTLFENSLGFYLAATGRHSARDALIRVVRLPSLYAFGLAILLQHASFTLPDAGEAFFAQIRSAYVVLGMMIIGLGIANLKRTAVSPTFILLMLGGKLVLWPVVALLFITLDQMLWNWWPAAAHQALLLVSLMPIAANTVVIASLLDVHPDRVAVAVVLSTVAALLLLPWWAGWLALLGR